MFVNTHRLIKFVDNFLIEYNDLDEAPRLGSKPSSTSTSGSNLQVSKKAKQMGLSHYGNIYYGPDGQRGKQSPTHKVDKGKLVALSADERAAANVSDTEPSAEKYKGSSRFKQKTTGDKTTSTTKSSTQKKSAQPINVNLHNVDQILTKPVDQLTDADKQMLRGNDRQKVLKSLYLTKQQHKYDQENGRSSGIGAGTLDSRAGECAIVDGLLTVVSEMKQMKVKNVDEYRQKFKERLDTYFDQLSKNITKDMFLKEEWVKTARASANQITNIIPPEQIAEICWDTPEGRKLSNSRGDGTGADMFVVDKNGTRWGISLKKNGNVFLMSGRSNEGALMDISEYMMSLGADDEEVLQFQNDLGTYHYDDYIKNGVEAIRNTVKTNKKFKAELDQLAAGIKKNPDLVPELEKYIHLYNDRFFDKMWTGNDVKMITRLLETASRLDSFTNFEIADDLSYGIRSAEKKFANKWLNTLKTNPTASKALKRFIIDGAHFKDIIGIGLGKGDKNMDRAITVYGEGTDGFAMTAENLATFFTDNEKERAVWNSLTDKARKGDKKSTEQLMLMMENRIQVDFGDSASRGEVLYKRPNPSPPPPFFQYSIFGLRVRSKETAGKPSVNIEQDAGLTMALKYGTDVNKWPTKQKQQYFSKDYLREVYRFYQDRGTLTGASKDKSIAAMRKNLSTMMDEKQIAKLETELKNRLQQKNSMDD